VTRICSAGADGEPGVSGECVGRTASRSSATRTSRTRCHVIVRPGRRRRDGARERADVMLQDGQRTLSVLLSRSQLATSPPTSLITVTRVPRQRPFTDDRSGSHANPASCRQHGRRQFLGHVGLAYHGGCA
jgi:hypothetical protein